MSTSTQDSGRIQRLIIDHLSQLGGSSLETLRWQLWSQLPSANKNFCSSAQLPSGWNTSFTRAVNSLLKNGGRIIQTKRPLETLDELVAHYPNKTLHVSLRNLRLALLPKLAGCLLGEGDGARYNTASNENFHLNQLPRDQLQSLREKWISVATKLVALLSGSNDRLANSLFKLLARGKELFEDFDLKCHWALSDSINEWSGVTQQNAGLQREVKEFYNQFLPQGVARHLKLKSYIQSLVQTENRGRCQLRESVIDYLEKDCADVISEIPGYTQAIKHSGRRDFYHQARAKHGELLRKKLIDNSIYLDFRFLRLAQA